MQFPTDKKNLTVQEAADALNVRRERIWKLLTDGVLTAVPSKLDGRQKLIPREQVETLLLEEGYRPRRVRRARTIRPEHGQGNAGATMRVPRFERDDSGHRELEEEQRSTESNGAANDRLNEEGKRRMPRTVGAVDDESFQASESEAYMHAHRDRERSIAE